MIKEIELLAPGGDIDSIKAAIIAGADAVYCGLNRFNARNTAENISFDDLRGVLILAHKNNCQVFLTLNIIILEDEFPALFTLLNKLVNTGIDGIIVQDLGLMYILSEYFKNLKIHASTQLTTHNAGQIEFLNLLNVSRVNLSRELNIDEIETLTSLAHNNNISTEVFVHGSNCISFSGICYMSSFQSGNSGNRGRCSQPCRDKYLSTPVSKEYPLNLKDNSAYFDLKELHEAGVDTLKIEGRIKKSDYVYTVVTTWKKQIRSFYYHKQLISNNIDLYKVFNRDFSNSFLKGEIHKDMFIDHPRDHSIEHLVTINNAIDFSELEKLQLVLYNEKDRIKSNVEKLISTVSIAKSPLNISITAVNGSPLKIIVNTPDASFEVFSTVNLVSHGTEALSYEILMKRLKAINETDYFIDKVFLNEFTEPLYISFNEINAIKKKILFRLNDSKEMIAPIKIPKIKKGNQFKIKPELAVFISSALDVSLCNDRNVNIYYQLPESFRDKIAELILLFENNKKLIPSFPSVIIGDDFTAALEFLHALQPEIIVTNNTGIAYEAFKKGISWIAGPYLNIVNSYSLLCLKENFNCCGAFLSNEINKPQLQRIQKPDDFKLFYSIYHPVLLMTSRQCLFHQISGCEKDKIDNSCIKDCEKIDTITNYKKQTFIIDKTKGRHHRIFNENNYLNTAILNELPWFFNVFAIDLSDVKTATKIGLNKSAIIQLFENLIKGDIQADNEIRQNIYLVSNNQYTKGL
ncbi:MAG: peptidase U32 family protein [Bacteroidales bacterium]